jgi:hypothetical protein
MQKIRPWTLRMAFLRVVLVLAVAADYHVLATSCGAWGAMSKAQVDRVDILKSLRVV